MADTGSDDGWYSLPGGDRLTSRAPKVADALASTSGTGADDRGPSGLSLDDLATEGEADAARKDAERAADGPWSRVVQLEPGTLTDKPQKQRWLLRANPGPEWPGFYPMGKMGILAAPGGTGKSMALVGLALAVTSGRPWLQAGRGTHLEHGFRVDTPGRVALLLGEEDPEDVRRRLFYTARMMDLNDEERQRVRERLWVGPLAGEDVTLVDKDGERDPRADALFARLKGIGKASGEPRWSAVLVDPLSRFGGVGAEKDNALATRAIQALERLTKLEGNPAVLLAHHVRKGATDGKGAAKDDADAIRGSSAIVDGARWAAVLSHIMDPAEKHKRWRTAAGNVAANLRVVKTNYTGPMDLDPLLVLDKAHHGGIRMATPVERAGLAAARAAAAPKPRSAALRPKAGPAPVSDGGADV